MQENRPKKRILELLTTIGNNSSNKNSDGGTSSSSSMRKIHLRFLLRPVAVDTTTTTAAGAVSTPILPTPHISPTPPLPPTSASTVTVTGVVFKRTRLIGEPNKQR